MDVVLVNPMDETQVSTKLGLKVPPLNLMYLAAALEKDSAEVNIIDDDLKQKGPNKLANEISKLDPNVVGITATTASINTALNYIDGIKKNLPNVLTVVGGSHATFLPEDTLKECKGLDVVVIGEGEETIVDLTNNYIKNGFKNLNEVKGIAYKNNGVIKRSESRELIKNLDEIPFPARHLLPFESYGTSEDESGGVITSRGCVFNCGYCSSSLIMGKKFRGRSPSNVVDELEELVNKYKIRDIAFLDDTFMLNKRRAQSIANAIKERGLDISFVASSRVDKVDKKLLESLKQSGMATLYYGVESGSQRILNLMKKGITLKQAENAVKTAKNVGVDILTSFILGYPGETPDEMDKTIKFAIKLDADYSQFSVLTPFPGTPVYYELKSKNLLDTEHWNRYTVIHPVIKYEKLGLSKKIIEKKLAKAYLKFYTRPKYILKHPHMLKVFLETVYRSFIIPKFNIGVPKGWYRNLRNTKEN
ncbi:MAG: B12-binding domain-containing radical SAM protein [Methanobacteriaceae archaeon]|nr:B12-binding domain-containing radical SAM protein [Methanobacteriaceae archaeon]